MHLTCEPDNGAATLAQKAYFFIAAGASVSVGGLLEVSKTPLFVFCGVRGRARVLHRLALALICVASHSLGGACSGGKSARFVLGCSKDYGMLLRVTPPLKANNLVCVLLLREIHK